MINAYAKDEQHPTLDCSLVLLSSLESHVQQRVGKGLIHRVL